MKFPRATRQKRPKLPWLPAAKSTTEQRVKFVPKKTFRHRLCQLPAPASLQSVIAYSME